MSEWKRVLDAVIYDSNNKGAKLRTKKGVSFHGGFVAMEDGTKVYLMVVKGPREGTLNVSISKPPADEVPTPTS